MSSGQQPEPGGIVFHMVSVGEALAAINLIKGYRQANPDTPITVTCTTPQASNIIREQLGESVFHCYLPFDFPLFLNAFVNRIKPKTFIILETELWPNLIFTCYAKNHTAVIQCAPV